MGVTFAVTVEMMVDGGWVDITRIDANTRVLITDGEGAEAIVVTRGRGDEQGEISPTTLEMRYLDRTNRLDGENPASPWYRKVGMATPVRVLIDGTVRVSLELASLRTSSYKLADGSTAIEHEVSGADLTMRLEGVKKPTRSASSRYYMREQPWQWWAMESGQNLQIVTVPSSIDPRAGGGGMARTDLVALRASPASAGTDTNARTSGVVSGDQVTGPPGSSGAVSLTGGGQLQADFPPALFSLGLEELIIEGAFQFSQPVSDTGSGSIVRVNLGGETVIQLFALPATGGGPMVFEILGASEDISLVNSQVIPDDGDWHHVMIELLRINSISFDYSVLIDGTTYFLGSTTAIALLDINQFTLSATGELGAVTQWAIWRDNGQGSSYVPTNSSNGYSAYSGLEGFSPDSAAGSLLEEAGIQTANTHDEDYLGELIEIDHLDAGTLMDQVHQAADAGQHLIYATRDDYREITRWLRTSSYNRLPDVTLTYAQLLPDLSPVTDAYDGRIVNDVTVSNGAQESERYAIPDDDIAHWTTQDPPAGVGVKDQGETLPIKAESLRSMAAWLAHVRSWRERRFLQVTVELAKDSTTYGASGFTPAQRAAVLGLDIGHVLAIDTTGAPATMPYSEIRLIVQGYVERISKFRHTITLNTTPADAWEVKVADAGPGGHLAAPITNASTSLKVGPGDGPPWSITENFFHVQIAGDVMTATAVANGSGPTLVGTPGAAAYADNASVVPALPTGMTADAGQLMLCFAAARGTGTADPVVPAGWTELFSAGSGELKVFGRYYQTGDTAPTVAVTGGAAGTTVGAQISAFSGLSMTLDKNKKLAVSATGGASLQNAIAQNVAFPDYTPRRGWGMTFIVVKKDDDWTGAASPPAGFTEGGDSSSTLGNDMGLAWYYNPETSGLGEAVAAGSVTITGGATATSTGLTFGLRGLQTFTVTRGVANTPASHSVGDEIRVWRPGMVAL